MSERADQRHDDNGGRTRPGGRRGETANERFKGGAGKRFVYSIAVAAAVHALVFWSGVGMDVMPMARPGDANDALRAVELLAAVEAPDPPPPVVRPAEPRIEAVEPSIDADDLSIDPVEFEDEGMAEIPPLPPAPEAPPAEEVMEGYREWTPMMVRPALRNPNEVRRELQRRYPSRLVNRGVNGRVVMLFWIDETGAVQRYEIKESSGNADLDRAAEDVVEVMEFQPAVRNGEAVKVVVALPITFRLP